MDHRLKALLLALLLYLPFLFLAVRFTQPVTPPEPQRPLPLSLKQFAQKSPTRLPPPPQPQTSPPAPKTQPQTAPTPQPQPQTATDAFGKQPDQNRTAQPQKTTEPPSPPVASVPAFAMPSLGEINAVFTQAEPNPTREMLDLYGDSLEELSADEQEFLQSNLSKIGIITQRYLHFPELAGKLGMEGETVLEFYLLPNGDITPIQVLHSSQYAMLDDNAIETVELAYKSYPRPKEKTRIRLRVHYINYGRR